MSSSIRTQTSDEYVKLHKALHWIGHFINFQSFVDTSHGTLSSAYLCQHPGTESTIEYVRIDMVTKGAETGAMIRLFIYCTAMLEYLQNMARNENDNAFTFAEHELQVRSNTEYNQIIVAEEPLVDRPFTLNLSIAKCSRRT